MAHTRNGRDAKARRQKAAANRQTPVAERQLLENIFGARVLCPVCGLLADMLPDQDGTIYCSDDDCGFMGQRPEDVFREVIY